MTKSQRTVYDKVLELTAASATGITQALVAEKLGRGVHTISGRFGELVRDRHLRVVGKAKNGVNLYARYTGPTTSLERSLEALQVAPVRYYGGRDY